MRRRPAELREKIREKLSVGGGRDAVAGLDPAATGDRWDHETIRAEHHPDGPRAVLLSDEDRAKRLRLLTERVFNPDGLDRETLARIEGLTDQPR